MAKTNTELKKAYNKLEEMSSNEQMRKIAEWRYMGMVEHNSAISSSYDDGYNSGKKDGYIILIKKMLENGISIDTIKSCTGFSLNEIKALKKEIS